MGKASSIDLREALIVAIGIATATMVALITALILLVLTTMVTVTVMNAAGGGCGGRVGGADGGGGDCSDDERSSRPLRDSSSSFPPRRYCLRYKRVSSQQCPTPAKTDAVLFPAFRSFWKRNESCVGGGRFFPLDSRRSSAQSLLSLRAKMNRLVCPSFGRLSDSGRL